MRDGPRRFTQDSSCPALLRIPRGPGRESRTGLSPSMAGLPRPFRFPHQGAPVVVLQPRRRLDAAGLGSSAFARRYSRNHGYFLLLRVLRCFSSPRSPPFRDGGPSARRVAPFGYPGIRGYLLLPRAFRSLSRPSSPPRAKASTVRPCSLSLARRPLKKAPGVDMSSLVSSLHNLSLYFLMSIMSKIPSAPATRPRGTWRITDSNR